MHADASAFSVYRHGNLGASVIAYKAHSYLLRQQ